MRQFLLHLLLPALAVGCANRVAPPPPDAPEVRPLAAADFAQLRKPAPTTESFADAPLDASSLPAAHYDGRTVAYLVPADSPVRITGGGKVFFDGPVRGGEIILLDPDAGIRVAGRPVLPGPLPAGATFDLYLNPDAGGQFRTGTVGPPDAR